MLTIDHASAVNKLFKASGAVLHRRFLARSEWFTAEQIRTFQLSQLRATLRAALATPYYRATLRGVGLRAAEDLRDPAELRHLPILDKRQIRARRHELLNPGYRGIAISHRTSGSSGEPLELLLAPQMVAYDKAMVFRHRSWATSKLRPTIFSLRSYVRPTSDAPLGRYDVIENTHFYSAYDLSLRNARRYVDALVRINPDLIRGYPSSIALLCAYLTPTDVAKLTRLRGVYVSSETLETRERESIEAVFGARVFNWYGMTEPAIIIMECEHHPELHVCWEYGYAELLETPDPSIRRLVTTSFHNPVMPLLRYDTGDLVEVGESSHSRCGRTLPIVRRVLGRKDELLVGSDGALIPSLNLYSVLREYTEVQAFQIVQYASRDVVVNVRCRSVLEPALRERLRAELGLRFGPAIPIRIAETDRFVTSPDGKTLPIVRRDHSVS